MKWGQFIKLFFYDIYVDLLLAVFLIVYVAFHFQPGFYSNIGVAITAISLIFWVIARLQLGSAFAVEPRANNLVTTGIYSKIRHPMYLFSSLVLLGFVLILQNKYWLLVWLGVIIIQMFRIRSENKILAQKYGAVYKNYISKTWF